MSSSNLLSRVSASSPTGLSAAQMQVDGLVGGFTAQATDWRALAAMTAGGLAYRVGRIGTLALGSGRALQVASLGTGLAAEVSAFELTHRGLLAASATSHGPANLWRWNGPGGLEQGLLHSFVSFGALRGAGRLAQGQNLIAQHFLQDAAMVGGHHLTHHLGLSEAPRGTLVSQFLEAEAVNLQMQAGMVLSHGLTGARVHALERGLDLAALPRLSPSRISEATETASSGREASARSRSELGDFIPNAAFSINPAFLLFPKALIGLGMGWVLSNLRGRPAAAILAGAGALLAAKNIVFEGNALHWAGDGAMLGIAAAYAFLRSRSLSKDLERNPFRSQPDMQFPAVVEPPANLQATEAVNMKVGGTQLSLLGGSNPPNLERDGFPRSFIWAIAPTSGLSTRQKRFYALFDPIRFSLSMGRLSRSRISSLIVPSFARRVGVDLSRFVNGSGESRFLTFDQFFTRRFKNVTPFYPGAAPCEGTVIYMARGSLDQVLRIKGETVNLRELLGTAGAKRFAQINQLGVIITYLSPRDYHLGHSPVEGKVTYLRRIPGKAWTVMPQIWMEKDVEGRPGTHYLNFNARDVILKETPLGPFATVYVAATNVFSTEIHPKIGDTVKAGMHEQSYHFGSTNVYVFDASRFYFPQSLKPGQQLTFGKTPFLIPRTDAPAESRRPAPTSIAEIRQSQRPVRITFSPPKDPSGSKDPKK